MLRGSVLLAVNGPSTRGSQGAGPEDGEDRRSDAAFAVLVRFVERRGGGCEE